MGNNKICKICGEENRIIIIVVKNALQKQELNTNYKSDHHSLIYSKFTLND